MAIDTPRPEYMQVADALRAAIEAGEWEPGALIPPEPELATEVRHDTRHGQPGAVDTARRGPRPAEAGPRHDGPPAARSPARRGREAAAGSPRGRPGPGRFRCRDPTPRARAARPIPTSPGPRARRSRRAPRRRRGRPSCWPGSAQMYASGEPVQMATSYIPLDIAAGTPIAETGHWPGRHLLPARRARPRSGGLRRDRPYPPPSRRGGPVPGHGPRISA